MECPSCYDTFDDKDRTPRNLYCGHTFCEKCLTQLQLSQAFNCPICRKQHLPFKAIDLPKNYLVLELIQKQAEIAKAADLCKVHPEEQLRFFCVTCSCLICPECIVDHSGHQFIKHNESKKVEDLVANIAETIEEADNRIEEILVAQKELKQYSKQELDSINESVEKLISIIRNEQEKIVSDFESAVSIEERKLLEEESKYTKAREELKAKSIDLGNLLETLVEGSKLKNEKEQNSLLETIKSRVQLLQHKCNKGGTPIIHPPSFSVDIEPLSNAIKDSLTVQVSGEEYGISKKICYFGEKVHVLKMDLETETWEHVEIHGLYEFAYYAAAVSTHDGNALIVGGGNLADTFLYFESDSM